VVFNVDSIGFHELSSCFLGIGGDGRGDDLFFSADVDVDLEGIRAIRNAWGSTRGEGKGRLWSAVFVGLKCVLVGLSKIFRLISREISLLILILRLGICMEIIPLVIKDFLLLSVPGG
jgi:hypothetical protein